ncbi:glycoside hydrolase family 43 protein [Xylanibacter brevis]|uniref:glycoside hydrolase family 43 protein n=1 Tax=Xylanibacter brevis TaxID=83231 RepID=UPI0005C7A143|nr:glycoside hydrolase family 43 protein [Xylanibacter brevis]
MKQFWIILTTLTLFVVSATVCRAQRVSEVPLADPYILLDGDTYYAYGTGAKEGIEYYTSKDLQTWQRGGLALHKDNTSEEQWFWAPEVYLRNGRYYMYYSANEHLYVAVADSPRGPFKQVGGRMMKPLIGDEKCIDSSVFQDEDGRLYCFFVRFTDGNCIWVCELEADGITPKQGTLKHCFSVSAPWEEKLGRVNEGPFMVKHKGTYYLTYSGNDFRSHDYGVGYATSQSPMGPWTKFKYNPIVQRVDGLYGTGHHSFFTDKDGKMRIVFHAHYSVSEVYPRGMYIGTMKFSRGKMKILGQKLLYPNQNAQND